MNFENCVEIFMSFNTCPKVNDYKYVWADIKNNIWYVERRGVSITPYSPSTEEMIQMLLDGIWMTGYEIRKINPEYKQYIKDRYHGKYNLQE